jgi:two-component system, NtrC family, sensor kinase
MMNLPALISRSLAAKLISALVALILAGGGLSLYALIHSGRKNLIKEAVKDAAFSSQLVRKSVRYSMLTINRKAIQRTIDDLKSAKDIRGIKLFDSRGVVRYSSNREEIGRRVALGDRTCLGCHTGPEGHAITPAKTGQWTTYRGESGHTMLTYVTPIFNEASCSSAACHVHAPNQRVLGVLEADFSLAAVDRNISEQAVRTTEYALTLMGLVSLLLSIILRKLVLKPVTTLSNAMGNVAQGDLGHQVTPVSKDEIGLLVRAFNGMIQELGIARERMEDWTASLEREVTKKSNELKKSQDKLVQAEKFAALGRLTADVAHEIRNPLTAIGGFARRLFKNATGETERQRAEIIVYEVRRLEKILRDVLLFSRDARSHMEKLRVEDLVNDVAAVHRDACGERNVNLEVAMQKGLPAVLMDADQVRRAITNLITNGLDAMPRGGDLRITAGSEELNDVGYVFVKVADSGEGVSDDEALLIFEPFFTTKKIGHGTGLGLSITKKIIEEHGGFIRVESVPGEGAAFILYFPLQSEEESRKRNCWEFKKCGRDGDATMKCPAYPHFGRICWAVAGTFCESKVQGTFAQKYEDCRKCDFYRSVRRERA